MIRLTSSPNTNHAKNVIIFVGDGMGIQTGTMARIYKGQKEDKRGEESILEWEKFATSGMSKVLLAAREILFIPHIAYMYYCTYIVILISDLQH